MSPHVAEGNGIGTPGELAEWIRALLTGDAGLDQEYADMMMDVEPGDEMHSAYGLGITYTSGLGYGHNGVHSGDVSVVRYDPEYDVAIAVCASSLDADDFTGQVDFLYLVSRKAREILGYPSEAGA